MKKHLHPDRSAFAKRVLFFAIIMLMSSFVNRTLAQCNVAAESNVLQVNPTGCNNGSIHLGAGATFNLTVLQNTYYNFSWSNNSAHIIGFCAQTLNGTAVPASFTTNQVGWFSASTTSLEISGDGDGSGNWDGVSGVMTYRYSTPTATASASPLTLCQGGTLNLTSSSTNAYNLTWTGPLAYNNTSHVAPFDPSITNIQPQSGTYTFTADNSGCDATATTSTVTVNTAATVTPGGPDVTCQSATPTAITLSGSGFGGGASNAAWSITSGGGTLSSTLFTTTPNAITYTPAANFTGTVTLTLTTNDPDGVGPCAAASATRTITVSPAATANAGGPGSICENSSAAALTGASVGGSATTGAWSISSGGGSLSSTTQTATPAAVTYTPAPGFTGTVTLLLTTNNPGGACSAGTSTRTITVGSAATATAGGPDVACQSASPSAITLSGSSVGGSATTGAWSISSGGGSLSSTAQTASPSTVTYTPAANFSGTATLLLTTNNPGGGCGAVTATRTITINQAATANAGGPDGTCQSATPAPLTLSGSSVGGAASTGAWSISSGGGSLSSTSQTATPSTVTYTAVANFTGTVTLLLTTLDPDGAGPCAAATSTRTIIVSPAATATAGGPDVVCQSATPAAITLSGSSVGGAASTGAWSITSGGGSLSSTAQTGSPNTITYTPAANFFGTATLLLTTNNPGGACSAATDTRTITVNQSPIATPTNNTPLCSGNQINLNANASLGLPAYSYSWTGPDAFVSGSPSPSLSNADTTMSGAYNVTVTDQNSCSGTATTNVVVNPLPQGNISGTTSICAGTSAQITFNFTTGTGPFNIIYTDGTTQFSVNGVNNGDHATVFPSTIGVTNYSFFSITDANTCNRGSGFGNAAAITVTQNPIVSNAVPTAVLCNGGSTGTITVSVTSGTPPDSFSIDGGTTYQSSNFFGGLPQGNTYNVEVKDVQGCTATWASNPVTITQPPVLTQADSLVNASCANVFDGKITVYAAGGVTPYQYSLNAGPTQSGNAFTGVSAGNYAVAVIDANNCVNSVNVTIGNSYIVSDTILSQTNVSCFGGSDGAVTVQITGGTPPYVYSINGTIFQSSPTFTGLTAVSYVVTLRDSRGCTDFLPVTISQQPQLSANIDSVTNVSCHGTATGIIYLGVSGGTPGYIFNWSNAESTQNDSNLVAGTYTVTISDANNCSTFASATVTQPLTLFVNVSSFHNLKCFNDSSGSITLSVSGGVPGYTFNWSNGATTQDLNDIGAANYTVTVADANGCSQVASQLITQPNQLIASSSDTAVSCNGGSNGAVALTVTGGTTAYSFLWSNGATTQSLSGVVAGTYTVVVTDAHGCATSNSSTVTQPNALVLTTVVTNTSCNGDSTGAIALTVTGGTLNYSFAWSDGETSQSIANLPGGTYTVIVTDGNSCTASASATVTQAPPLIFTGTTVTDVNCNGAANGSIDVTVSGGTTPYSYTWDNGVFSANNTGLSGGIYNLTVTDNHGCSITATFLINEPAAIVDTISGTNVTCHGAANGTTTLAVGGGTSPYSFQWSTFQTTQNLSGLNGGTYYVVITDANGCTKRDSVIVTEPTAIVLSISVVNIACNGSATGSVDLTVSGGTPGYTYLWNTGATTQDLNGVGAGTYVVQVKDTNSCVAVDSGTVTQSSAMVLNATTVNVSCAGGHNGSIDLTVNGGTFPYTYAWSNSATTQDISGLTANTYSIIVTDAGSCTAAASYTITEPAAITTTVTGTNVTCNGQGSGTASVAVSGGTSPYTFHWNSGQTTQSISGLSGGTYFVLVTDDNGCTKSDSIVITEPAAITLTLVPTNVLCNGDATGGITLTVNGGVPTFIYNWSDGSHNPNLGGVVAGPYTVTVIDGNSCSATGGATITQPSAIALNATTVNVACAGGNSGSIDLTVNGGVFPYTYLWSNAATTQNINGLSGNTYTVTVKDANLCSITASYTITEPTAITTTVTGTNVTCNGQANGTASVAVAGGTTPYSFHWNTGQTTQTLSGLSGGTYFVVVTDANGCTKSDSIVITEAGAIVLTLTPVNVLCNGAATGGINLTVTGGVPNFIYNWSDGSHNPNLSGVVAGPYTVTVIDGNSCSATGGATITQPAAMVLNATTVNVACAGGNNGSIDLTVNGGVFPYTYLWSNAATTQNINGLNGNTYSVTVKDANLCSITASYTITEPAAIGVTVTGTNVTCHGQASGTASVTVSGGSTPYSFHWNTGQTTQTLSGLSGGTYFVVVSDANGCSKSDSIVITEPAAIVLTLTPVNVLCNGAATGGINLTVTGGVPIFVYNWSDGSHNPNLSGVVAGTYTVTVIDGNSCTATGGATITQPAGMVLNATTVNVNCAGGHDGSIDLTVNGGVFPYTYLWSNAATTQNINGLNGNTYTVTVKDANLCSITASYVITEPQPITAQITGTNPSCHGSANGTATLTVGGGTAPYSFLWSTFAASQNLSGLSGGTYFVIITDANGCTKRDSVIIIEPSQIVVTTTVVNASCNGSATGSITLTVTGGTPAYSYSWTGGSNGPSLTNVVAGTYRVTVTDNHGCFVVDSATITEPGVLVVTGTQQNVHCAGGSDGSIDLQVSGGTTPYHFIWSANAGSATTQNVTGLAVGTYTVTTTDANACSTSSTFTLTTPNPIVSNVVGTNVTCNGNQNGTATLTVSGGTTPYSFLWSNFQTTQNLSNLSGGTYFVLITDASGCTKRDSVIIHEPSQIFISDSVTNISCFNANDGSIYLTVTGGNQVYTFHWNDGVNTENRTGLSGGQYGVTVTDGSGCSASASATIINPAQMITNFVVHDVLCYGQTNGSVDVIQSGGTPNYTFQWNVNGNPTIFATTQDISNLDSNYYIIKVTDSRGCFTIDTAKVNQPGFLYATGEIKNVSCHGFNDGAVITVSYGGTLPYSYVWSNGQTTKDLYSVGGGQYLLTVSDANGCQVVSPYTVTDPAQLTDVMVSTNVSCFGGSNGTVAVIPSGGTGVATASYKYLWSNFETDSALGGLMAGKYVIQLSDSNNCKVYDSVTLTQPTEIVITGLVNNATCFNTPTGSVTTTITGGTPAYNFSWSSGATSQNINTASAGSYTITVTDSLGCQKTAIFVVDQPTQMFLSLLDDQPSCFGSLNGSISVAATQATPPYTYIWSTTPVQNTNTASNLAAGNYTVTVSDSKGCTATATETLVQPAAIVVTTNVDSALCFNTASGEVVTTATGGVSPYVFDLNGILQPTGTFTGLLPGNYLVIATDINGCTGSDSFHIASPGQLSVTLITTDQFILTGMHTQLVATAVPAAAVVQYQWSPITVDSVDVFDYSTCGGDTFDCNQPYVSPPFSTTFTITVYDANHCAASDTVTVYVSDKQSSFVPSAFTPNGDGLNDRFTFDFLGATTIDVNIFDRWGANIYHDPAQPNGMSNSIGWDGTVHGKLVPEDTYVYQLKVTYFNGTVKTMAGTVTVMR